MIDANFQVLGMSRDKVSVTAAALQQHRKTVSSLLISGSAARLASHELCAGLADYPSNRFWSRTEFGLGLANGPYVPDEVEFSGSTHCSHCNLHSAIAAQDTTDCSSE